MMISLKYLGENGLVVFVVLDLVPLLRHFFRIAPRHNPVRNMK
ncbi:unnamed protein product [Arabidopsis halleri]